VFADLDEAIRALLVRGVPLDPADVDVSFDAPDREWSSRLSRPTVNCFLYDVRENHQLRETDWDVRKTSVAAVKRRAPLRIDATYQVTVWARVPEDEHRLLGRVLATLFRYPHLPEEMLSGGLREPAVPIPARVAQPDHAPQNFADLWQSLENRIRPSLTYVVTVPLDPEVEFSAPLVLSRTVRVVDLAIDANRSRGGEGGAPNA
jgi:hypothetical protein